MDADRSSSLTIDDLSNLRNETDAVSSVLEGQLKSYLDTLRPLYAPRRILGRHVGSRDDVTGSDRTLSQLKEKYREVCRPPFTIPPDFPDHALSQLDNLPVIYAWEYTHVAKNEKESKSLTLTSPVRWILTYDAGLTLTQLRSMLEGKSERRNEAIRLFVVNALVMHLFIKSFPGVVQLFAALRYEIRMEALPGLGDLPFVTVHACLDSFRPANDLLLTATRFSGVPAFIELIHSEAVRNLQDPLKIRLDAILK